MNVTRHSKTILRRPALLGLGGLLLALLALATAPPERASAAPGTPRVTATAEGDGLRISTAPHSVPPARWEITISASLPPQGDPPTFGRFFSGQVGLGSAASVSHRFGDLQPGHTYHYIVRASDDRGGHSYATGSVKTRNRDVGVSFKSIRIINDGDGFLRGKGEISFEFALNKCWVPEFRSGRRSLDDGDRFSPNAARHFSKYQQGTIDLAVYGEEGDQDTFPGADFCPSPLRPGCESAIQPGHGSDNCRDWAQAATTVNIAQSFDHTKNSATETVRFTSPSWDGLRFEVEVELTFIYLL